MTMGEFELGDLELAGDAPAGGGGGSSATGGAAFLVFFPILRALAALAEMLWR